MDQLMQILSGVPWWAYALLVYLLFIGIRSMKPHAISIKRIILLPTFFTLWSLYNLSTKLFAGCALLIPAWILFLLLGTYAGIREVRAWKYRVNREKQELTIPGNPSTLILILLIFSLKFFWGYYYATHTAPSCPIYYLETASSALITGFFIGRATIFIKSYLRKH